MRQRAFSLVEILVSIGIVAVLVVCINAAAQKAFVSSSLAISANNIRQLAAGSAAYLAENNYTFWPYVSAGEHPRDVVWWYGYETGESRYSAEGTRWFDASAGHLGAYVPGGLRADPSFKLGGKAFKPKYKSGFIGVGYNVLLGAGNLGNGTCAKYWDLPEPGKIVVFATSAQINTFQRPASASNPMLEEYYAVDDTYRTVHFRHRGFAMVAFANGSADFLPMDESTRDNLAPKANVGRFAPVGSTKYLLPDDL